MLMLQVPLALAPTQMSGTAVLLGLLGLGALLFALQRLRVRHRSRLVVTTLFWREALEESRARTLFERFRHPLTYLLLAMIGGLLWLSVARLEGERDRGVQHTFLLDGSANMAVGDRFEDAVEALTVALESTPRERTEVLFCGDTVTTLLAPGDDRALLGVRLEGLRPVAVPSSIDHALARAAAVDKGSDDAPRRFVVVGDQAPSAVAASTLRQDDWLEHLGTNADAGATPTIGNVGITALGIAPSQSGTFDALDALVEVRGAGAESASVAITLGGAPLASAERRVTAPDVVQILCRDLRPEGAGAARVLVATLNGVDGDALAADNRAEVMLPELRLVRVHFVPTGHAPADDALRAACRADSAIELVENVDRADVTVGGLPAGGGRTLPSLTIASSADQDHAIEVQAPGSVDPDALLASAVGDLGLDRIDATRLASELGRPLSLGSLPAARGQRTVSLWAELFDPSRSTFTESRAFPLVVGRTARWLAGTPEIVPYAAAGRPRPTRLAEGPGDRYPWAFLPRASEGGSTAAPANLLDSTTTLSAALPGDVSSSDHPDSGGSGPWRFATWVLALVLALLLLEWVLYQRGRIA